jgi:putative nucleotidyltransferase with HDIG domain
MNIHTAPFEKEKIHHEESVSMAEVVSAMTFALDLTEAARPGHALRSCLLGMRLAEALGVPHNARASLYYALQLKDVGCSNNAARMTRIVGGDERAAKSIAKMADWTRPHRPEMRTIKLLWANVLPKKNLARRALRMARIGLTQHRNNKQMIDLRCERGASILSRLEMGHAAAEAVLRLDEHWDGKGYPDGLRGDDIPLAARICAVAQNLDVFAEDGEEAAMKVLRKRSGRWFDPDVVWMAELLYTQGTLWTDARPNDDVERTRAAVLAIEPNKGQRVGPDWVNKLCEAFADVVDVKSHFTTRHSALVAELAVEIGREMRVGPDRLLLLRRAGLMHDLGKLSVPNVILEKEGKLEKEEWAVIKRHPGQSRVILERVEMFTEMAKIAGEHHEKLDGTGYPLGIRGDDLSLETRILVVADCYTALAEKRPYRRALSAKEALAALRPEIPDKMDEDCFRALERVVLQKTTMARWSGAHGLAQPPPARQNAVEFIT